MSNNQRLITFTQFQQLYRNQSFAVTQMMNEKGSSFLKKRPLFKQCTRILQQQVIGPIVSSILMPTAFIFIGTILLHRKRQFALTSGTLLRRVTLKYLPAISIYSAYRYYNMIPLDVSHLEKDYAQIQEQFSNLYVKHSPQYLQTKGWLSQLSK